MAVSRSGTNERVVTYEPALPTRVVVVPIARSPSVAAFEGPFSTRTVAAAVGVGVAAGGVAVGDGPGPGKGEVPASGDTIGVAGVRVRVRVDV